ncbi:hypothetical protein [Nonomuraea sp. GTA35]
MSLFDLQGLAGTGDVALLHSNTSVWCCNPSPQHSSNSITCWDDGTC